MNTVTSMGYANYNKAEFGTNKKNLNNKTNKISFCALPAKQMIKPNVTTQIFTAMGAVTAFFTGMMAKVKNHFTKENKVIENKTSNDLNNFTENNTTMIPAETGHVPTKEQIQAFNNILEEIEQNPDIKAGKWDHTSNKPSSKEFQKQVRLKNGTNVIYTLSEDTISEKKFVNVSIDRGDLNNPQEHVISFYKCSDGDFVYVTNRPYIGREIKYISVDENGLNKGIEEEFNKVLNEIESMPDIQQGNWDYSHSDVNPITDKHYQTVNKKTVTLKDGSTVQYIQTVKTEKSKYRGTDLELPNKSVELIFGKDSYGAHVYSCKTDFTVNEQGEIEYFWSYTPNYRLSNTKRTERTLTPILND